MSPFCCRNRPECKISGRQTRYKIGLSARRPDVLGCVSWSAYGRRGPAAHVGPCLCATPGRVCEDQSREHASGGSRVTRRGLVLFALMSFIWGIPYLFIRIAVDEITPATLVFVPTTI